MTAPLASLLVVSCDAYADLWPPFFSLLERNWPDCPFQRLLLTNSAIYKRSDVRVLQTGPDEGWATNLSKALPQVETPYVLMMLEDFLLNRRVVSPLLIRLLEELHELQGAYLRLRPFPPADFPLARFPLLGEIEPGAPYRAALQAAFWKVESLRELLIPGETPWEMEHLGSRRSDMLNEGFYCVHRPALSYVAGVSLGKWTPWGIAACREQGIPIDRVARTALSKRETLRAIPGKIYNRLLNSIPWKIRRRIFFLIRSSGLRKGRELPSQDRDR